MTAVLDDLRARLDAKVAAARARALAEHAARVKDCRTHGHVQPDRMRWQSPASRCARCGAVTT